MILKRRDGFTLIEAIVAIAIIAMIGVILTNIVSTSLKARTISQERLQILALCTSSMDEIKSVQNGFSQIDDIDTWLLDNGYSRHSDCYKKTDAASGIEIEVYLNQNFHIDGLYEIKVVGKASKASELSISTMVKGGNSN